MYLHVYLKGKALSMHSGRSQESFDLAKTTDGQRVVLGVVSPSLRAGVHMLLQV